MADVIGNETQDERDERAAQELAKVLLQHAADSRQSFEVIGSALLNALVLTMQAVARADGIELPTEQAWKDIGELCTAMAAET